MASIGLDRPTMADVPSIHNNEKDETHGMDAPPVAHGVDEEVRTSSPSSHDSNKPLFDSTHRKLKPRHIQLIGIGGYVKKKTLLSWKTDAEDCSFCTGQLEQRSMCR